MTPRKLITTAGTCVFVGETEISRIQLLYGAKVCKSSKRQEIKQFVRVLILQKNTSIRFTMDTKLQYYISMILHNQTPVTKTLSQLGASVAGPNYTQAVKGASGRDGVIRRQF